MTPDQLRAWRQQHGHTQVSLAAALGVSEDAVRQWERPEGHPRRRRPPPYLRLALERIAMGERREE
jgi:DNA-binding transcriptional regulator YiaG